jgi:pimeloyl-ACP methyl ester carboxylesterase
MEAQKVTKMDVFGLSYGGFVAYSMAAQFKERVGRVALGCAGVCFEEKDVGGGGVFKVVTSIEEAAEVLIPQTPEKARQLVRLSFYKPPSTMPSCFLQDFIEVSFKLS